MPSNFDKLPYETGPLTDSTALAIQRETMKPEEKYQIILNAFHSNRYGVSPTATRGAVESYAKKHLLEGKDYTEALEGAMDLEKRQGGELVVA